MGLVELIAVAAVFVAIFLLLLHEPRHGIRLRVRDVGQPSPDRDGSAVRDSERRARRDPSPPAYAPDQKVRFPQ